MWCIEGVFTGITHQIQGNTSVITSFKCDISYSSHPPKHSTHLKTHLHPREMRSISLEFRILSSILMNLHQFVLDNTKIDLQKYKFSCKES